MTRRKRKYPWLAQVAESGGKARWKGVARAERAKHAKAAAKARWEKTPLKARQEAARRAVQARWARHKQKLADR